MRKNIIYSLLVLLMAGLCSCGSKSFEVEGNLNDKGRQNLRFVYFYEGGISSTWIPVVEGSFKMTGNAEDLTIVYVFNSKYKQIFHFVTQNGETVGITGSLNDLTFEGNEINRRWSAFIKKYAKEFNNGNYSVTDKAIEDYIKANPSDIVSTLLLLCDYQDISSTKATKLLESIDESAKPESILKFHDNSFTFREDNKSTLNGLRLRNENDSIVDFKVGEKGMTLLYFWDEKSDEHSDIVKRLKALKKDSKNLKIADVFTSNDTSRWSETVKLDSVKWDHHMALCGTLDKSIKHLDVSAGNFFIVSDSLGKQIYRGSSLDMVEKTLKK